ncbi:hypothetical protein ACFO3D_01675 [Virgibacillus kekensis]|uniref:Sporulation protein n=1 Tax=Virgibacillus kekensis TaxID=202261 RepID=A0ABV9DDQ7_9BACI
MSSYRIFFIIGLIILLTACTTDNDTTQKNDDVNYTNIAAKNNEISQSAANAAKERLRKHDEITNINAVNTDKILLITVELHHNKRFRLAKIRKNLKKEISKEFPDYKVEFSTDKKIVIELNKLEKRIEEKDISKDKLKKEVKHLVKLMKEQT